MSTFLKHAEEIFETARQGKQADCEMAILVGRDGGIHMLPAYGWGLEPMRLHHGARTAYRVTRNGQGVRVEARSAGESCLLEAHGPEVSRGLSDFPRYRLIAAR